MWTVASWQRMQFSCTTRWPAEWMRITCGSSRKVNMKACRAPSDALKA
jgi:hypothetical protein